MTVSWGREFAVDPESGRTIGGVLRVRHQVLPRSPSGKHGLRRWWDVSVLVSWLSRGGANVKPGGFGPHDPVLRVSQPGDAVGMEIGLGLARRRRPTATEQLGDVVGQADQVPLSCYPVEST